MMNIRTIALACALGTVVAAGGALPAAAQVYGGVYVQTGPPAPIVETVPVAPGPGYYWVSGYWRWNGHRYVWAGGYYAAPPYSGARWHPGHWASGPYGWYWRPGHWAR